MSDECSEQSCWSASIVPARCDVDIIDHCQPACDACTFNEPSCKVCMTCMNSDDAQRPAYTVKQLSRHK